jgi:hypothetical protein
MAQVSLAVCPESKKVSQLYQNQEHKVRIKIIVVSLNDKAILYLNYRGYNEDDSLMIVTIYCTLEESSFLEKLGKCTLKPIWNGFF